MNTGTLHPPNSHLLRDDLVAGAVQCTRRAVAKETLSCGPYKSSIPICVSTGFAQTSERNNEGIMLTTSTANGETTLTENMQHITMANVTKSPMEDSQPSYTTVAELLELGYRLERKRRIDTQKRYRKRKEESIDRLAKDVQGLRDEIKTLELHHRRIYADIPAVDNAWMTAMGYFRVVRHRLPLSTAFTSFIDKTMASNIMYNHEYGIEVMIRGWCVLGWFGDVKEELVNLKRTASNTIVATTKTSLTITQQTLIHVFPHLLRDEDFALRSKILGQRIVMDGSTCFVWGGTDDRVTSVIAQSDMLTPVMRLLESWEHVSWAFGKALISCNFQWRSVLIDEKHLTAGVSQ